MTTTVAAGKVGSPLLTLTADTAETVTFTDRITGPIEVVVDGSNTDGVWYTNDGTVPTVGGANCYYVPPGWVDSRLSEAPDTIKLISSGTPSVRVQVG